MTENEAKEMLQAKFFVQPDSLAIALPRGLSSRYPGFWPGASPAVKGLHFRKKMCPGTLDSVPPSQRLDAADGLNRPPDRPPPPPPCLCPPPVRGIPPPYTSCQSPLWETGIRGLGDREWYTKGNKNPAHTINRHRPPGAEPCTALLQ